MRYPERRFAGRAASYDRYRPTYPEGVYRWLSEHAGVPPGSRVADVGAGTGIFSSGLAARGFAVTAVEPDEGMRRVADRRMLDVRNYRSVAGTAEATTLPSGCAELVVAAQAFHWFRPDDARREFSRILLAPRRVALVWNRRLTRSSTFAASFEDLLRRRCPDYGRIDHRKTADVPAIRAFFDGREVLSGHFRHAQRLDWAGLEGRLLSCSYAPLHDQPGHAATFAELRSLFDAEARDGEVTIDYRAEVFASTLV